MARRPAYSGSAPFEPGDIVANKFPNYESLDLGEHVKVLVCRKTKMFPREDWVIEINHPRYGRSHYMAENFELVQSTTAQAVNHPKWAPEVKELAYTLDPACWESYSGKSSLVKRAMDKRRLHSLELAQGKLACQQREFTRQVWINKAGQRNLFFDEEKKNMFVVMVVKYDSERGCCVHVHNECYGYYQTRSEAMQRVNELLKDSDKSDYSFGIFELRDVGKLSGPPVEWTRVSR